MNAKEIKDMIRTEFKLAPRGERAVLNAAKLIAEKANKDKETAKKLVATEVCNMLIKHVEVGAIIEHLQQKYGVEG